MADHSEMTPQGAKRRSVGTGKRHRTKNNPLTNAVMHTRLVVDPDEFQTFERMEAQIDWLTPRIATMEADRADELAQPRKYRDEHFLALCGSKLRAMRNLRATLHTRRNAIRHERNMSENRVSQERREQLFIAAARDLLTPETFQMLWARVDSQNVEAAGTGLAAR